MVIVSKDNAHHCTKETFPNHRAGCQLRFKQEAAASKKKIALQARAPSAVIVAASK